MEWPLSKEAKVNSTDNNPNKKDEGGSIKRQDEQEMDHLRREQDILPAETR